MQDSFDLEQIDLTKKHRETTRSKAANKSLNENQDQGKEPTPLSPPAKGKELHQIFSDKIKKGARDGTEGEMLKEIESRFRCELIQAEVSISGFSVRNAQIDLWRGKMDAVAIRRKSKGVLEVFVVDWKTSEKSDVSELATWWKWASNYKPGLYQCLVYRELLQAHLKRYNVEAVVGIILVPCRQPEPEISHPGLCVDFEETLLVKLRDFQWLPILDESNCVYTIKLPCKLFNESFDTADDYVDESNVLKGETRLKDILNDNATVADLRQVLDLPFLKVEDIKDEEKKAQSSSTRKEGRKAEAEQVTPAGETRKKTWKFRIRRKNIKKQ